MRRQNVGAKGEERSGFRISAGPGTTGPVLEPGLDQLDADEHDGRSGDEWREDLQKDPGRGEGEQDFEQCAYSSRSDNGAIGLRARQWVSACIRWAKAVCIHLLEAAACNGDDGEGDSNHGDEAGTDVVSGHGELASCGSILGKRRAYGVL